MFERFTPEARMVVVDAQEEARELNHHYLGTEHLLLGLLRQADGPGPHALRSHGVELDRVRADIVRIVRVGELPTAGQIPLTPRAKRVLELAVRAADDNVGSEHVLLGLLEDDGGVAMRVLIGCGADLEAIRRGLESLETVRRGARAERATPQRFVPSDPAWFGALAPLLDLLAAEIRVELAREPDAGDLLVALAGSDVTLPGRALGDLGVDVDELSGAIRRLRDETARAEEERRREIEEVVRAKEAAIDSGQLEQASSLRDRERELRAEAAAGLGAEVGALAVIRRHLGIVGD